MDQDLAGRLAVQVSDDVAMEERDRVMAEEMAAAVAAVSSATSMTKSSTEMNHAAGVSIAAVSVAGRQNSSSSSGDGIAIPPPLPPPLPPGLVTPTYTEAMPERAGGGAAGASTPRYFFFGFFFGSCQVSYLVCVPPFARVCDCCSRLLAFLNKCLQWLVDVRGDAPCGVEKRTP